MPPEPATAEGLACGGTVPDTPADIGFVLADGLSPYALAKHGAGLLAELVAQLRDRYTLAPPVIATQARVGLGDHIAERAHVRTDADRNCISNIHPPEGLGYREAARVAAGLVAGAHELGRSGVDLKDTSRTAALGPLSVVELN